MRPSLAALSLLLFATPARAEVPVSTAGLGCDDDDRDGFIDDVGDCWSDFVRCGQHTNSVACLGDGPCSWRAATSTCEGSYWDYVSYIPQKFQARIAEPVELSLGAGMSADRAWQRTAGRWDTLIAVLDSGIEWQERELQNKHYLNAAELPLPNQNGVTCAQHDCNGDSVFNVQDYAQDDRVDALASNDAITAGCYYVFNNASALPIQNDFLEPGDLLCVFSDGIDDDGNGYVDDISGWDFLWDDNNPYDDTSFGHGTGQARDSAAEANNGSGLPGTCPNCAVMSVRAGDSFVVDVNNWGAAAIFAVDSGAAVLQSAVGGINNSSLSQAAIEYAYAKGVIDIVSAADETAQHQNYPGAVKHAEYVHAVRHDSENLSLSTTFLNYSNCTNFGARLVLSAPSTHCSSGATGVTGGVSGLIASAATEVTLAPPLTGSEIHQILSHAVDDIDLPSSLPEHAGYDGTRYPSRPGWDLWFGYGRLNARKAVDMVMDGDIPPEADLLDPEWFSLIDPFDGPIAITGVARANRAGLAGWVLEYALGAAPDDSRPVDAAVWHTIASGTADVHGALLGSLDATAIPGFDPSARTEPYNTRAERGAVDDNVTKALKVNRHAITLRLRVTDDGGREGEDRRTIYVHHDPTWKPGFPVRLGVSGESSPKLWDLDGDGAMEIIFGDADGRVHAFTAAAVELAGWPVATNPGRVLRHPGSRAFTHGQNDVAGDGDELRSSFASSIIATPAIGDIDRDGDVEVVAATVDGEVYAWHHDGTAVSGFPAPVPGSTAGSDTNTDSFFEIGIFATPVLADLDGDGDLEIILATLDQQLFALHGDATMVSGFPVSGPPDPSDPSKPYLRLIYDSSVDADGQGRRIISSPAVGDLDGDGNLEIVVGTNEAINDQFSLVYAVSYDRSAATTRAYGKRCGTQPAGENCWPIIMVGGYPNALPYVGEGTVGSPILADLDADGRLEIAATSIADFGRLYRHDGFNSSSTAGSAYRELKSSGGYYGIGSNSDQASSLAMINSGAFGDVDGDGALDYFVGTAGANFVDNLLVDGVRADFDHQISGWSSLTGEMLQGFPQIMEDLQFFLNPIIADIDGDGGAEVVNSSATFTIHAFKADGSSAPGFPKFTGQWQLATPAVGDIDGDGKLELAAISRAGYLFVYETEGSARGNVQWSGFRHDARNSGNFHTPDPTIAIPARLSGGECDSGCCCTTASPALFAALGMAALLSRRRRGAR